VGGGVTPRPIVAVTRRLPAAVEAALAARFEVRRAPEDAKLTSATYQRCLGEADGLLCTVTDRITAEVLAANPLRTRIIANFGVGTDNIDLAAAQAHEIVVTNTPDVLTDDTADLAMALILMTMRRAGEGERLVRAGRWSGWRPTHHMGRRVTGATLVVLGFGRIGQAVARRAHHGFGMRVLAWGRSAPDAAALLATGATFVPTLESALAEADVVSIHLPSTPETRAMLDARRLAVMPSGSFLVNTARGDVVDDDALVRALITGQLGGAGLDVYRREPTVDTRLLGMEQVVLLPHLGSATVETREAMGFRALANLDAFFRGEAVPDRVA
jgi:lactate dehydrogenase-like 2-hydroxyacid dehydrogenase